MKDELPSFEITRGHALPKPRGSYPFNDMQVGDTFDIPCKTRAEASRRAANARNSAYRLVERKYTARIQREVDEETGRERIFVRVWRVA